jgi:hypothetical protein
MLSTKCRNLLCSVIDILILALCSFKNYDGRLEFSRSMRCLRDNTYESAERSLMNIALKTRLLYNAALSTLQTSLMSQICLPQFFERKRKVYFIPLDTFLSTG